MTAATPVRTLVTGAAGFVGSALVDRLLAAGGTVAGVDDLATGRWDRLAAARAAGGLRLTRFELGAPGSDLPALLRREEPDVVVHLAARGGTDAVAAARADTGAAVALLEACRAAGVPRVVLGSTAAVFGRNDGTAAVFGRSDGTAAVFGRSDGTAAVLGRLGSTAAVHHGAGAPVGERSSPAPGTAEGARALAVEVLVRAAARGGGPAVVVLRLAELHGRGATTGLVAEACAALAAGRAVRLPGDGTALRDSLYVEDAVDALVLACAGAADGRLLHVGSGTAVPDRDVARRLASLAGRPDAPEYGAPGPPALPLLDVSAARRVLGWEPRTGLLEGLARSGAAVV